jgi:hypothetical protein
LTIRIALLGFLASLTACGGTSTKRTHPEGTGGDAGAGGSGEGGATGEPACAVDPKGDPMADGCAELERLVVENPTLVEGSNGDGRLTVGEMVEVSFALRDTSGLGYNAYPGVIFDVTPPGIAAEPTTDFNSFALLPCDSVIASVRLVLGQTIGPGTVIEVTARAAALNQDCPNTNSRTVRLTVE